MSIKDIREKLILSKKIIEDGLEQDITANLGENLLVARKNIDESIDVLDEMNSKKSWQAWLDACDKLLQSDLFSAYENAQKAFFESKQFKEYVDIEERVIDRGSLEYLECYESELDELCYGTPHYLRWVYNGYKEYAEVEEDYEK